MSTHANNNNNNNTDRRTSASPFGLPSSLPGHENCILALYPTLMKEELEEFDEMFDDTSSSRKRTAELSCSDSDDSLTTKSSCCGDDGDDDDDNGCEHDGNDDDDDDDYTSSTTATSITSSASQSSHVAALRQHCHDAEIVSASEGCDDPIKLSKNKGRREKNHAMGADDFQRNIVDYLYDENDSLGWDRTLDDVFDEEENVVVYECDCFLFRPPTMMVRRRTIIELPAVEPSIDLSSESIQQLIRSTDI